MDDNKKKKLLAIRNSERKKGNYNSYAEIFDENGIKAEEDFPKNPNDITKDELHEHFDLDNDGKVTLDEYAEHIEFHCKNPEVLEEELEEADFDKGFKYAKGGKTKEAKTWKQKYNKKYGNDLEESNSLSEISEDTGVSKKGIQKIYNKGIGAYKTNPSSVRPNVKSKEQWAQARVYSAVMGGKSSKVDAKELKMEKGGEINDWYISLAEREYFVNYMSDFYGDKGIYAEDYDGGFTNDQIEIAVDKYIQDPKTNWGGGDSVDRELTRDRYLIPAYEEGGALSKEFKFDKNFVIYVPSTSNVGDKISNEELEERVNEVEKYVANEFGGYTETDTDGGYKSTSGEIIEEDIVKVSVFANNDEWNKNESKVVSKVKEWARRWGQEAIGFEYEGDLYYIDESGKFKKGGLTPSKANKMLSDGMAKGKPLTDKQMRYFGAISSGKVDKIREKSRMKRGGEVKNTQSNNPSKINYELEYLYNQLKISQKTLSESISQEEKEINLMRVQSIKKIIDKNLNSLSN